MFDVTVEDIGQGVTRLKLFVFGQILVNDINDRNQFWTAYDIIQNRAAALFSKE